MRVYDAMFSNDSMSTALLDTSSVKKIKLYLSTEFNSFIYFLEDQNVAFVANSSIQFMIQQSQSSKCY